MPSVQAQHKVVRTRRRVVSVAITGLLGLSCADGEAELSSSTTGVYPSSTTAETPQPTWITTTSGDPAELTSGTSGTSEETTTTGPGTTTMIPDFGDQLGCNGKIDFLFVIDRAEWMEPYVPRFQAAFPDFIDDVLESFPNFDMHFMAVDGRGSENGQISGWGLFDCQEQCPANNGSCVPMGPPEFPCEVYEDDDWQSCGMKGAGITFPAGFEASNHNCGVVGGGRFVDSTQQPNLSEAVKCISKMGYSDSSTRPDAAMVWAVAPNSNAAACNQGFLRSDALLVIVYFTGFAPDQSQLGPPENWANIIYGTKADDEDQVIVIGLIDDTSAESPAYCGAGWGTYVSYSTAFVHLHIKHSVKGSICAEDYRPFFEEGLELIGERCDTEIPT